MRSVSIIIAAYNEESNLVTAINTIDSAVRRIVRDYELILIDDGSTDKTGMIAEKITKKNPKIKVIHFKSNHGLGAVYKEGVRLAKKKYVMLLPGDGGAVERGRKGTNDLLAWVAGELGANVIP